MRGRAKAPAAAQELAEGLALAQAMALATAQALVRGAVLERALGALEKGEAQVQRNEFHGVRVQGCSPGPANTKRHSGLAPPRSTTTEACNKRAAMAALFT